MRGLYLITNDDPLELLLAKLEGAMEHVKLPFCSIAVKKYPKKNRLTKSSI